MKWNHAVAIAAALAQEDQFIADWIRHPTQTNEVARGAAIMAALMTVAARSSGRTRASTPPYRPTGVRTALTIHASRTGRLRSRVMPRL